jgi:ligand-binding sensor domain-containing protein
MRQVRAVALAICVVMQTADGGTGVWRNFTSMQDVRAAARAAGTYWCATSGGLFAWDASADTYRRYTNAENLRTLDLTAVAVDPDGLIWTGTGTGLLHVLDPADGSIRVITDIAAAAEPDRRITSLLISGDTTFICTAFGLSVFLREGFSFRDTYARFGAAPGTLQGSVRAVALHAGRIWAVLQAGLAGNYVVSADRAAINNLPPESWTVHTVGAPQTLLRTVTEFNGRLYAGGAAGLFVFTGATWEPVASLAGRDVLAAQVTGGRLAVATTAPVVELLDTAGQVTPFESPLPVAAVGLVEGTTGDPLAATSRGLLRFSPPAWVASVPNGPSSNQFISLAVDADRNIWTATGYNGNGAGFSRFGNGVWTSFTRSTSAVPMDDVYRVSATCDGSVWASMWGGGVVEMPRGASGVDSSQVFGTNAGLVGLPGDPSYLHVSTVECDGAGRHWMSVNQAADGRVLARRNTDGSWRRLGVRVGGSQITSLIDNIPLDRALALDGFGTLWAACRDRTFRGLAALPVGTLAPDAVDVTASAFLNESNGLPSGDIRTVVVDRTNDVWVGTDRGIAIILEPDRPTRPGGIAAYRPLNGIAINSIAVDPINQKWVATPEGVVLLSADGTQTLATYTVAGTGGRLIENDVRSIALDSETGTVYFGTSSGLASLTTAGAAPRPSFTTLVLSPNPYVVPSETPLTVDGLVENSSIRILTVDGRLVRALTTPGGRVGFWDGRDDDGRTVPSGIYLVVAFSEDGSEVTTGKVAVVRR